MAGSTRSVLITGSSSGIGRAASHAFADAGWHVIATMRDPAAAGDLAERDDVDVLALDVSDQASVDRATADAIAEFEARRAELEKAAAAKLAAAQAQADKMSGHTVNISQKAGVDGRLFGSVTNHDIAEALGKLGFVVDKAQVRMPQGPLKTTGDHPLTVALHTDVAVEINVAVLGEQA